MTANDPRRQDLTVQRGTPFTETLYIPGDLSGKAMQFRAQLRGSDAADPLVVDTTLTVGAYDSANQRTPATLTLPATGSPAVEAFTAGPVYVYRVQIENGPPIAWGELHAVPEWEAA